MPCEGSELRCGLVNPQPVPDVSAYWLHILHVPRRALQQHRCIYISLCMCTVETDTQSTVSTCC